MNSFLFEGRLMHSRRDDVRHHFVYSVFMLLLDLDDLPVLDRSLPGFGHGRRALVSIHDGDHLPHPTSGAGGLKAMVLARLAAQGIDAGPGAKVYMLTNPRIFGYVFNPITVYYVCDANGAMVAALAEVNNTFGDQHPYVLGEHNRLPPQRAEERRFGMRRYAAEKVFYVSPWIPMDARYELALTPVGGAGERLIVHIDEYREGQKFFEARLWGDTRPLTARALRGALLRYPFMTLKVIGAIMWEGIKIHLKGGPFYRRRDAYRIRAH